MGSRRYVASSSVAALSVLLLASPAARAADAAHPTVVELFESQGCSSCPPAAAAVAALTKDRPDLLMLTFEVTYWDDLGWTDTFGSPAYTARQRAYASAWNREDVFTPEVVVNGRADLVGSDRQELASVVAAQNRGDGGPAIDLAPGAVTVSGTVSGAAAGLQRPATVLLVRYEPRTIDVPVARGENGGRTLPERDVVRELDVLGSWIPGATGHYALPPPTRPGLADAVLVQAGPGGPIIAARG